MRMNYAKNVAKRPKRLMIGGTIAGNKLPSKMFSSLAHEQNHIERMHRKSSASCRRENCNSCRTGTREHNWPEKRLIIAAHGPFHLSKSNFTSKRESQTQTYTPSQEEILKSKKVFFSNRLSQISSSLVPSKLQPSH